MSEASDFFGSGGGNGIGLFPIFPPKRASKNQGRTGLDGYLANGDYFVPPASSGVAATLTYHSNTGTLIWSKVPTNINASCDNWGAFTFDGVDNLLWVTAIDDATGTNYLATINAAGTVIVKGSFAGGTSLSSGWYGNTAGGAKSGPSMWRDVEGVGNFFVTAQGALYELNYLTGAKVNTMLGPPEVGWFKTTGGVAFTVGAAVTPSLTSRGISSSILVQLYNAGSAAPDGVRAAKLYAPFEIGLPVFGPNAGSNAFVEKFAILHWRNELVFIMPSSIDYFVGPSIFDYDDFLEAADQLVLNYKMEA